MTQPAPLSRRMSRRSLLIGGAGVGVVAVTAGFALAQRDRFDGNELSPPDVLSAVRDDRLMLIDIRRPDEWEGTGIAEGAQPLDMRRDDFVAALSTIARGDLDRPIALICARGVRSDRTSARLLDAGFTNIIDVPEGMLGSSAGPGWLERGLPVVRP